MMLLRSVLFLMVVPIGAEAQTRPAGAIERYVAIDNVCAWPNLTLLGDGTIVAAIFNKPSHGWEEGDVECWAGTDGGKQWQYRGTPARHERGTNRMNVAAGQGKSGDLIVLVSGLFDPVRPNQKRSTAQPKILEPWVCRSSDGGRQWSVTKQFPRVPGGQQLIPFGDVVAAPDGSLRVSAYTLVNDVVCTYLLVSRDDGRTWEQPCLIARDHSETAILHLQGKKWLAAARSGVDRHLNLFQSDDDGETWSGRRQVTENLQIPAHLLRLADGRILLTYGDRRPGHLGVEARTSSDEGATWSPPIRLAESTHPDCGYPASVQRADGKIVTAYYAASTSCHNRYHMGVVIWKPAPNSSPPKR